MAKTKLKKSKMKKIWSQILRWRKLNETKNDKDTDEVHDEEDKDGKKQR